jgi:hypothetical protein
VNNDPVNWIDPWGLSASDRSNSTANSLEVQYTAQTVQYNQNVVIYYYEVTKVTNMVVDIYSYHDKTVSTFYSDAETLGQHRNAQINNMANDRRFTRSETDGAVVFSSHGSNQAVAGAASVSYDRMIRSRLPANLPNPKPGEVIELPRSAQNYGFDAR